MDLSELPSTIKTLFNWLEKTGFTILEERREDSHNQLVVLDREGARVRLLADRSEWSIALSFSLGEWTHPDVWEAYLDQFPLAGDLSNLDHQVQFLQERMHEMIAAANTTVEKELRRIDEEYMRRRLGIGPRP